LTPAASRHKPDLDVKPRRAQPVDPLAGDARIRSPQTTRRTPVLTSARHMGVRAPRQHGSRLTWGPRAASPRSAKRLGFAARPPGWVQPRPTTRPFPHDDAADRRVRPYETEGRDGECQRRVHRVEIGFARRAKIVAQPRPQSPLPRSARRNPQKWPGGSCGRLKRSGYRPPDLGSPTPPLRGRQSYRWGYRSRPNFHRRPAN
jgi:hypothetical protein